MSQLCDRFQGAYRALSQYGVIVSCAWDVLWNIVWKKIQNTLKFAPENH